MTKILIIDDESSILAYLETVLKDQGYTIVTASSAEKGLELINDSDIDIVISDIYLPDAGDPTTWMENIAKQCNGLPLLFITGMPDDSIVNKAESLGVKALLTKPFELGFIKDELQKITRSRHD